MKKTISALLISLYLSFSTPAEAAGTGMPNPLDSIIANLTAQIGSTMFAFYQFNYHEQVVFIPTLKYCGYEDEADSLINSFPDLALFYQEYTPEQAIYDMVNKEAMRSGVELKNNEVFDAVSKQSVICAQAYFQGYIKGYQMALETMFDKKVMKPFCEAAIADAGQYIQKKYSTTFADR